ncbi:MAG: exodeoxyribonuclease V subunit beta [Desulfobacterales bacterium]|nr:MAG: exodeoxyribonuclease V subunit beta [Desulfobacterales bacterium]
MQPKERSWEAKARGFSFFLPYALCSRLYAPIARNPQPVTRAAQPAILSFTHNGQLTTHNGHIALKPFDLLNAPLEGVNLIEAGAGTGKTYNIEGLFVRLILETQLQLDQILVLTFTNAATEELRDRIRHKLVLTKEAFARGGSDEPFIASLIKRYPDSAAAGLKLHEALIDFDKAAIFTIHGFCQRVLNENAFETHNLFDTELITNQSDLIKEVADDFWRNHIYHAPVEFISFILHRINGPEYFYRLLDWVKTPDVKILPALAEPALDSLRSFRDSLAVLKSMWPASREVVTRALRDPGLNAVIYGGLKPVSDNPEMTQRDLRVITLVEAMDRLADQRSIGFPLFEKFERLTSTKLEGSTKKKHTPPRHEFFDLCDHLFRQSENLNAAMANYFLFLKSRIFPYAAVELKKRKKERNIQFFDDLLVMLRNALQTESHDLLEDAIRYKYKAALVDEFQDTDNIQYEILSRLFAHKNSLLFMIGDPKQAIYSFRGADIFSYMKASRHAAHKFNLTENWRSRPGLIKAVNTIFSSTKLPFVFDEIPFENGKPAEQPAHHDDTSAAPFILWYLDSARFSAEDKPVNKEDAVGLIGNAVGVEISRLVSGAAPVEPGEIAVLVRTNDQAQLIKNILSSKNVPAVLYSTGNIFDSAEAYEVEKILSAIVDPAVLSKLKAAMSTDIMGARADDLFSVDIGSRWWESRLSRFREYHRLWDRFGFIRMFRRFLAEENVKERLLCLPDGERRLTNVLHLAEILHRQFTETNSGMTGLLKWLAEQRDPRTPRLEEHQLRLESDERAVKIVTIHKSKGLEYPVVFCPFGWESSQIRGPEFTFHDIDDDRRLTLDLGSESNSRNIALAQNELLSENLRLFYVALTRAKQRCYLAWGRINSAETSAPAYLLHCNAKRPDVPEDEDLTRYVKAQIAAKTDAEFIHDLNTLAQRSQHSIQIEPLPTPSDPDTVFRPPKEKVTPLFCRQFNGNIDYSWKISSYSSLVSTGAPDVDSPDRDVSLKTAAPGMMMPSEEAEIENGPADNSIFAFPRGSRAGIFFHDIFEHHDFAAQNPDELDRLAAGKLQQYGFDSKWQPAVSRVLRNVLSIALRADRPQLKLSSVRMTDRMNEMEFYFPLKTLSSHDLAKTFRKFGRQELLKDFPEQLEQLHFTPCRGFVKGYIDLVFQHQQRFYLVDWKSNYLGPGLESYDQPSLHQAMKTDYYILQYHLYTLALHQYLHCRKSNYRYAENFGGVFYIFIRGVDKFRGPDYGIFFDLPEFEFIQALGEALIPGYK